MVELRDTSPIDRHFSSDCLEGLALALQSRWITRKHSKVDFEYVRFLHDLFNSYHDKLSELSASKANSFRVEMADAIAETLDLRSLDEEEVVEKLTQMLAKMGLDLQIEYSTRFHQIECRIDCPLAHNVHRSLSRPTFCPTSMIVLGALRLRHPNANFGVMALSDKGSQFVIKPND